MPGKPRDPDYWRKYRASHPEYRARERTATAARHQRRERLDRSREYARRRSRVLPRLGQLFPLLAQGTRVSFWRDELRADLAQERELAKLEGRDPEAAAREYERREVSWLNHIAPLESYI